MGTYIFYTDEGYTIAPNDEELDSLQVLGIEDGNSREEALANLYKNNEWIKENGFRESRMRCYAIIKPYVLEDIKNMLQYLWDAEVKHREKAGCPDEHIFQILSYIKKYL